MKYYLFIDECGDQNLSNFDAAFPIFTLCGILISEQDYHAMGQMVVSMKKKYWGEKKIVLHSRDIRKCEKGFEVLFDLNIKKSFYQDLNTIMQQSSYTVVSCCIQKESYIRKYGKLSDVYGLSLSYIIERTVFFLDSQSCAEAELHIFAEKRGKREDAALLKYYNEVLDRGTYFVSPPRIKSYFKSFTFKGKWENIIGLQVADLAAYPIARHVLDSSAVNMPFDVVKDKIYTQNGKQHGLKIFP
ncbi:MAG: DUF3800 domain-containing protein [Prevotellaceae bacterium]|nr:DUF3800 domain-containing protein [Prevotellaceae bacterium]